MPVNATASAEFYTLASERSGNPEAQYKLGYLYGTNYARILEESNLTGEGAPQHGSVRLAVSTTTRVEALITSRLVC